MKPNSEKSVLCTACGFEYFFNPAAAVAAIIVNANDELLVTVRASDPGKGMWDLPGGFVDPDETGEAALIREIKEELNLKIDSMAYFCSAQNTYVYKEVEYRTLDMAFICRVNDLSTLRTMDDIEAAVFVPIHQIDVQRFCFSSMRKIVSAFRKKKTGNV